MTLPRLCQLVLLFLSYSLQFFVTASVFCYCFHCLKLSVCLRMWRKGEVLWNWKVKDIKEQHFLWSRGWIFSVMMLSLAMLRKCFEMCETSSNTATVTKHVEFPSEMKIPLVQSGIKDTRWLKTNGSKVEIWWKKNEKLNHKSESLITWYDYKKTCSCRT